MTPRRRHRQPLSVRPQESRRQLLVFTEGEKTEEGYLVHWRRLYRDDVVVTVDPFHGGPKQLVDRAVLAKRREQHEHKRGRGIPHDQIWCVFDVDQHPHIPEAVDKALANGIALVVSNPCIELWFLLHFEDQQSYIERGEAQRRSEELLCSGKTLLSTALEQLVDRYETAKFRAETLEKKHVLDGSPPRSNPGSDMYLLVESIREGRPS